MIGPDAPEWPELRMAAPHDVYDAPSYVKLSATHEGGQPAAVYVEHDDGSRLLIPLIIRDIDGALSDASSPYGYPGVLTDRPTDGLRVREAMAAAVATLREAGVVALFVRLHPLLRVDGLDAEGTMLRQATVAVDLSKSGQQIWAETRQNHRRDIKRAQREGCVFEAGPVDTIPQEFRRIYNATMDRLDAESYYRFPASYFDRLPEAMENRLHLATVMHQGRLAAAGLFTECDGVVQSYLIAVAPDHEAHTPTKLLYHRVSMWAKQRGNHWFHLGGGYGSDGDTLFHFKLGFSRIRTDFATLRVVVRDADYQTLLAAHAPSAVATDMSGYFPGYRQPDVGSLAHGRR